jgi:hypothetical protein
MLRWKSRRVAVRLAQLAVVVGLIVVTASCAAPSYTFLQTYHGQPVRWNPCAAAIHYRVNLN